MYLRTAAFAAFALALAACNKSGDAADGAAPSGKALPTVAAPAGKAWSEVVEETPEGGVRMGNPDAPIKLIEYGSLSCPHCAKLSQEGAEKLTQQYVGSGRVSWEFRSFAIHPQDIPLTVLVRCASKDAFFPLVDQIYVNFDAMNKPLEDQAVLQRAQAAMQLPPAQRFGAFADAIGYTQFFAQRGVAADQAKACLADTAKAQQVADLAQKYGAEGIDSTPTLLVNGSKLNVGEWAGLETALQNAGAR